MAVNIPGVISVLIFYLIILAVGIWAGRKSTKSNSAAEIFLANRNMGFFMSVLSLTATMVGGAFLNGTAEVMATSGLLWTLAPFGYCFGLFCVGQVYAPRMRRRGYVTLFDPLQEKYGLRVGALMCIPQFMGDVFWTAAVLSALGSTISIILNLDSTLSVIISAVIAVAYTVLGGLLAVASTDIIQFVCIIVGLAVACPFAASNPAVDFSLVGEDWLGQINSEDVGHYIDMVAVVFLGGIPWQVYFQRVLACKNARIARLSPCVAAVATLLFIAPPAVMGLAGRVANWNMTAYPGPIPMTSEEYSLILPLTFQYLCPPAVAVIGIGTMSAAVMSSADSSILASATVFTCNVYTNVIRPRASEREIVWVLRISIVVLGVLSTVMAIVVRSVYGLYVMCSDLMLVVLFPQFTSVLFLPNTNAYGGLAGFFISLLLRIFGGDQLIHLPPLIKFPFYDEETGQGFPFRTLSMLCAFLAIMLVSWLTHLAYHKGWGSGKWDYLGCFSRGKILHLQEFDVKQTPTTDVDEELLDMAEKKVTWNMTDEALKADEEENHVDLSSTEAAEAEGKEALLVKT